ncbi:adenosylcobinamide-GDP ribazoletransferase [Vibrio sp. ZSDZ34]|uniref:Adenosylcobinamide-GDP ribazoletransferase n=1 Tax=Vibrio gelatinilyticus TaxID=2893468 RepID=A0A9X1W9S3_9VIBR|nr:adenosylcobinamide-GDP ribazoletransferase [Vibrio gelatinilyticus]MCJ2375218.1 adenosylcobinamide-GDP ribazoletransferase [Vibrio gelatinilyticus]
MGSWLKTQAQLFLLAVSFFSRIPIPSNTPYSSQRMNRAGRYFALVGALLGLLCASVYFFLNMIFASDVAVFFTMCFSLLLTGAFHEDGLADMADGVGGGMTVEKRLSIMKDSRLGTYGVTTLVMALLGKFLLLSNLAQWTSLFMVWITAYTVSRSVAASLISALPYVSDADNSKSKPLASSQTGPELTFLVLCGLMPLIVWPWQVAASLILVAALFRFAFKNWLKRRLGGFTGDCLGAAQQIMELCCYVVLLVGLSTVQV